LVFVPDPDTVLVDYDKITLYKSTTGTSGDYYEILKTAALPGSLLGTKKESFDLNGKEFKFSVDGTEYSMTFGAQISATDAAAEIVLQTGQVASNDGGYVRINSSSTGLSSTVSIDTSTEGGVELGMYLDAHDIGEGAWISLVGAPNPVKLYIQDDPNSDNDYWYKYQFVNSTTLVTNAISVAFRPQPLGAIDPTNLIYGTGVIADTEGNPVANKKIVVYNRFIPTVVAGALVDGSETSIYETDEQGLISIPFVHGSKITIGIEDTKLRRDIDVPTTGDSFDLFDETLLDDRLGISYYPIVDGERTVI
jgi:hypothetical protein